MRKWIVLHLVFRCVVEDHASGGSHFLGFVLACPFTFVVPVLLYVISWAHKYHISTGCQQGYRHAVTAICWLFGRTYCNLRIPFSMESLDPHLRKSSVHHEFDDLRGVPCHRHIFSSQLLCLDDPCLARFSYKDFGCSLVDQCPEWPCFLVCIPGIIGPRHGGQPFNGIALRRWVRQLVRPVVRPKRTEGTLDIGRRLHFY